jgi:hypothetical protein
MTHPVHPRVLSRVSRLGELRHEIRHHLARALTRSGLRRWE